MFWVAKILVEISLFSPSISIGVSAFGVELNCFEWILGQSVLSSAVLEKLRLILWRGFCFGFKLS